MSHKPSVVAINRKTASAVLDDGTVVKFSAMVDAFGDETDDASEAIAAIAPLPDGKWLGIDLTATQKA
jgi:hypothetical protein